MLLGQVHSAFGGELRALFAGGAFTEPETLQFFYDLGIPVANGYGMTEAGTAVTLNDFRPFRPDTVGQPLPGMEVRILNPDADGIGEVAVRSKTVMSHYLDDPELTAETIVDGWLLTGDLGRIEESGHLQLFGRKKNMIVTEGKNIYPEDIENSFEGLPVKEFCIFAANYIWPKKELGQGELVLVLRLEPNQEFDSKLLEEMSARNRRLPDFKRVGGYLVWERDFPRTASMKIKRRCWPKKLRKVVERSGRGACSIEDFRRIHFERIWISESVRANLSCDRESRGGRRTMPQTGRPGARASARRRSKLKLPKPALPARRQSWRAQPMRAASRISLPSAETARRTKSSTGFFRRLLAATAHSWLSCLWAQAILFCATSPIAAWTMPSNRCSRSAPALRRSAPDP